ENWALFLGLLNDFNQSWAKAAAALVILVSKTTMLPSGADREIPSPTHSLDAGAAWASLALQATRLGWAAHGMAGFARPRAPAEPGAPPPSRGEGRYPVGAPGCPALLPEPLAGPGAPGGPPPAVTDRL